MAMAYQKNQMKNRLTAHEQKIFTFRSRISKTDCIIRAMECYRQ